MGRKLLRIFGLAVVLCMLLGSSTLLSQSYYLGTSANGYQVPRDGGLKLEPVPGKENWYAITIDFNEDNRDPMYDGHYYKVTDGTWNADGCWGVDNYAFQPAPVKKLKDGTVVGLGSIYIQENCRLQILFDANTKTIYDDYLQRFPTPRIYGDFNEAMGRGANWSMIDESALVLTDPNADGVFNGFYKLPAYTGSGDGYMMVTVLSTRFNTQYYFFGAVEQYKFDGTPAGMGMASYLKPLTDTIYEFQYDGSTHVTTFAECVTDQVVQLPSPVVYGDFNGWNIEGPRAVVLAKDGENTYSTVLKLPAYTGEGSGYMVLVCLSKKFYNDQWGMRWGAEEQYIFDGTRAGMGQVSYLKPAAETSYKLTYNSLTHVTTLEEAK